MSARSSSTSGETVASEDSKTSLHNDGKLPSLSNLSRIIDPDAEFSNPPPDMLRTAHAEMHTVLDTVLPVHPQRMFAEFFADNAPSGM